MCGLPVPNARTTKGLSERRKRRTQLVAVVMPLYPSHPGFIIILSMSAAMQGSLGASSTHLRGAPLSTRPAPSPASRPSASRKLFSHGHAMADSGSQQPKLSAASASIATPAAGFADAQRSRNAVMTCAVPGAAAGSRKQTVDVPIKELETLCWKCLKGLGYREQEIDVLLKVCYCN